jgi:hypothetical protein
MAISYQSKDDAVLGLQLKVQEICAKKADVAIVSVSGLNVTIDVKESVKEVRCAIHCDDSIGLSLIAQAGITISGSQVTLALSNALADNDSIVMKYVVVE